ncbi:MAG: cellulose biosynthesis cyclic di-GMP-binding regulatory protein BcsB [Verrucomicrobiales bacterium]|nr:cellulose biosynthesis cyclic di-GMP-binding regulatory protein BcsB [Verrucomicrobiae bacterium]
MPLCNPRPLPFGFGASLFLTALASLSAIEPAPSGPVAGDLPAMAPNPLPQDVPARPSLSGPSAMDLTARFALEFFQEKPGPVTLRTVEAAYGFSIPVSPRMIVSAGQAEINYSNSISLLDEISQIALRWDDSLLAEAPLLKQSPSGRLLEELPVQDITPGYHKLGVAVAQHYVIGECEDPVSSVLWTQIDTKKSWIEIDYGLKPLDPLLSDLAWLIDPKLWGDYQLSIVSPGAEPTDRMLRWGSLVAQRAALMLDYKPLFVESATAIPPDRDAVVVGLRKDLAGMVEPGLLGKTHGASIGIQANPQDHRFFVLVLSGDSEDEVNLAVETFALWNGVLPAQKYLPINNRSQQAGESYLANFTIKSAEVVAFSEIGQITDTVKGMNAPAFRLDFSLPPDAYGREGLTAELRLHFAHGAGLREDSVVNLILNGEFSRAIPLLAKEGAVFRDYQVEIPLRSFRPGQNVIEFETRMVPARTGFCELIQQENLLFTLYDDSTIEFPAMEHYVRFPDLELWQRTGFPVTKGPLGEGYFLHVAERDPATVASAWMISGKLAQTAGIPLLGMKVSGELPLAGEHWLGVGATSAIVPQLTPGAPVAFGEKGRLPFILAEIPAARRGLVPDRRQERTRLSGGLEAKAVAGDFGLLCQYPSPMDGRSVATLVTAETREKLQTRVSQLIRPETWNGLNGDTVAWNGDGIPHAKRFGDAFYLGDAGVRTKASFWFSRQPWGGVALVLGLIVGCVYLLKQALAVYFRRNHPSREAPNLLA